MSTGPKSIPAHLHPAYDWTAMAGELDELAAGGQSYIDASASNAAEHGQTDVIADDLAELAAWLRSQPPQETTT